MIKLPHNFVAFGKPIIEYIPPYYNNYKDPSSCNWGWFISVDCEYMGAENCDTNTLYLHSDGNWRDSTLFNGKFTGHYKTKEDAIAALNSIDG